MSNEILLESGTNELELVEFRLGEEYYGINVSKVREIIRYPSEIVPIPGSHPSVAGMINLRERITPIIHLAKHLGVETTHDNKASRIIVTEFNRVNAGFWVNEVTRIHRVSWEKVEAPSGIIQSKSGYAVGVIKIEHKILLLLDFEKIASVINPETGLQEVDVTKFLKPTNLDRSSKRIVLVEDSPFIRDMLVRQTAGAGYQTLVFENGMAAWQHMEKIAGGDFSKLEDYFHLMITDLEMPQMDGMALIKRVKETERLKKLPCVVFSSIVSPEMSQKCRAVGSSAEISKPELARLIQLVDSLVL